LPPCFDGLRAAARQVGSVQVQNSGTLGGNLCNASPAADGVPPLLTLDASVELTSTAGSRVLTLDEFLIGYRQTALRPDELLTAVLVPRGTEDARSEFLKLGLRRYLVISVVMVAAGIVVGQNGRVAEARIAVGACSPVAQRLRSLETDLVDRFVDEDLGESATADHLSVLSPIDDVRGTAAYRLEAALALVRRALTNCGGSR
jgi:CO/xanthine dehydrogenase FAD-binding subunit